MKDLIKVYRWENGEILEKEVCKSDLKHMTGWRTEPDEAMLSQLEMKRYTLENKIFEIKNRIDEIFKLEDSIKNLNVEISDIPNKNNFGLSIESIKELITKLEQLI